MECAIKKSMPVLCSYVFVSMAYGMMMERRKREGYF